MNQNKKNAPSPIGLAKKLLEFISSTWIETEQFDELVNYVQLQPGPKKVDFIQRVLALIKRLPYKILDQEARDKITDAGREYLDAAITEEEELEESEED